MAITPNNFFNLNPDDQATNALIDPTQLQAAQVNVMPAQAGVSAPGGFAGFLSDPSNVNAISPYVADRHSIIQQPKPDFYNANSNLLQPPDKSGSLAPDQAKAKALASAQPQAWFNPGPALSANAQPANAQQPALSPVQPQVNAQIAPVQPQGVSTQPDMSWFTAGRSAQPAPPSVDVSGMAGNQGPSLPATQQPDVQGPTDLQQAIANYAKLQKPGWQQIDNPVLRALAGVGSVAASALVPHLAPFIPGTSAHNAALRAQQGQVVNQDIENAKADEAAQNQASKDKYYDAMIQTQTAKAGLDNQKANNYAPVTVTKAQAAAMGNPELEGEQIDPRTLDKLLTGQQKGTIQSGIQDKKNTGAQTVQSMKADAAKAIQDAKSKTAQLVQGMKSSTSQANTAARISGSAGGQGGKVPADVTKRAALASNVNENADAAQAVVSRNPDIVGAMGGRYSNVQQMMGSNDPDIAELGVRMHNMALASNGAHGVRSQEAVQKTEDELFNNFKMGPQGIKSALGATRSSVQTFLNDESNFQNSGRRTGAPSAPASGGKGAMVTMRAPNGQTKQVTPDQVQHYTQMGAKVVR